MSNVRYGIKPGQQNTSADILRRAWSLADEAGFESCWVFDHFSSMGGDPSRDVFEAWSLLSAMAVVTSRMRLGCLVTGNTYRHPAVLAKMAVTVDHLSGGRLDVGLGAGGHHNDLGLPAFPPAELVTRLEESCQILRLLWTESTVTFKGEYNMLDAAPSNPRPVQRPYPPLWIGTSGERHGMRIAARHADVWTSASAPGTPAEEQARLSAVLDRHCAEIDRDPASIRRAAQIPLRPGATEDDTLRTVEAHVRTGFTEIILMSFATGDATLPTIESAAALLPRLRSIG
jgi:alkanesulfonate monooxygenase SsuD/methylene tetrahydromethanopterin reductase-like flavin-dependent oxidoreductase (luciferase family)